MQVAWTTVAEKADADRIAREAIALSLAACVQVEGPVSSHYRWQGKTECSAEYRLTFKFLPDKEQALSDWLHRTHPYDTPEWIVIEASKVGEKYLSWARANSSSPPL
jgi:periplasmic divalent cation tolerance protein